MTLPAVPTAGDARLRARPMVSDLFVSALRAAGDDPALVIDDSVISAAEVADHVSTVVQALGAAGVTRDSVIAVLANNRPEVLYVTGAQFVVGCPATALHPKGSLDDHAYVVEDAGVDFLVYEPGAFSERARRLQERVPDLRLLSLGPDAPAIDLLASAAQFPAAPLVAPDVLPGDVHKLGYTGGTTGRPKGVVHTFATTTAWLQTMMTEWEWPERPRHLVCSPLSHAGGAFFIPTLLNGGSLVVLPGFDPEEVMIAVERHRITSVMMVPTMIYALLDHPRLGDHDLSSLQYIYYGAAAMSPSRLAEGIRRLGPVFFQFFGQAEAPMTLTVMRRSEHLVDDPRRLASCGRAVPWARLALLDDDGAEVADGTPGEMCVRAPWVMAGYLGKPEQTAEALADDWLHTGDVAVRDADGFLTIVDRKKDMIVSGGFNVFPREVEEVISSHPAVSQVAVIGVPDERWGEAVLAAVVLRQGATVDAAELVAAVKERKGSVHAPKRIEFVDNLPTTPVGKPDKKALRDRYWAGAARRV